MSGSVGFRGGDQPRLSIVTSLYKSREHIEEFHCQASRAAARLGLPYEIVLVNDGSPDDSLEVALAVRRSDSRVKVIDLSRNFGHHRALMTGLAHATGELVYVTDVDMDPSIDFIDRCHERISRGDCDVVYGYLEKRPGRWHQRVIGNAFWGFFNLMCETKLQPNLVVARLMTQRYVQSLLEHGERNVFIAGLWALTGYEQVGLPIAKAGTKSTSYSFWKRASQAVDSITSFSSRPLLLSAFIGGMVCAATFLAMTYLVVRWVLFGNTIEGWTSLMLAVSLLGGANLIFLGLVGLYVSKIFVEVKRRPYTIIREMHGGAPSAVAEAHPVEDGREYPEDPGRRAVG
jgi:putative glycosyltransferase